MKRITVFLIIFAVGTLLSCSKDQGNYSYRDINEVAIGEIASTYNVITAVDTLKITPQIQQTIQSDNQHSLSYLWTITRGTTVIDTVGQEAELNYPVDAEPGQYVLQLRIKDNETGVSWWKDADLVVGTPYSRGILLIGDMEDNTAEAAMISMVSDTLVVNNILSNSGLPSLQGGIDFVYTSGSESYKKLWIFTETGSYYLDRLTMKGDIANRFGKQIYTTDPIDLDNMRPVALAPQLRTAAGALGSNYIRVMLCADGSLFASFMLLNGGDYYTNPLNRSSEDPEVLVPAAPFILTSIGNLSSVVWYDTKNKRFMNLSNIGISTTSEILTDGAGDIFPWNLGAVGRDLVYGENTRNTDGGSTNGNSFAIVKDAGNDHYIYKFYAYGAVPARRDQYKVSQVAVDFDKADHYAFSSNRTVVFYSVGDKLYAYDYNPGNEKFYTYPDLSGDEITLLKFDTEIDYLENSLYLGSYNSATKGTLRRLKVGTNPNVVDVTPVEDANWQVNFKIKNMHWRSAN